VLVRVSGAISPSNLIHSRAHFNFSQTQNLNLTMPAVDRHVVYCQCCKKYLTRKREREHRKQAFKPYGSPEPVPSYRHFAFLSSILSDDDEDMPALAVVDPLEEDEDELEPDSEAPNDAANFQEGSEPRTEPSIHDIDIPMDVSENGSNGAILDEGGRHYEEVSAQRWGRHAAHVQNSCDSEDSDDETSPNIDQASDVPQEEPAGDDDEVDVVDWDALEREYGLSAKDMLGEKYEADAAGIGTFYSVLHFNALLTTP
jgi:hypothetical protein